MFRENPDFIGVFCYPNAGFSRCIFEDVKPLFSLWVRYRTPVQLNIRRRRTSQNLSAFRIFHARSFAKDFGLFLFHEKGAIKMYFTNTPSLNSMEAIMQRPPGGNQRGGGRIRRAYQFNKADCDCRLCLYHRKKKGCSMEICPVLDARLTCVQPLFMKPFMRHLRRTTYAVSKTAFTSLRQKG